MQRAEEALSPAAEGEEGHGRSHAKLMPTLPARTSLRKAPGSRTTAGKDTGHVPICAAVDEGDGFIYVSMWIMPITGPKISVRAMAPPGGTFSRMVGRMKLPSRSRG